MNTIKKFTLQANSGSGSYSHVVIFEPIDNSRVKVTQHMHDSLLGPWWSNEAIAPKIMPIQDARAFYRERKAMGYTN